MEFSFNEIPVSISIEYVKVDNMINSELVFSVSSSWTESPFSVV